MRTETTQKPDGERGTYVNGLLPKGHVLTTPGGAKLRVEETFGSGAQGEVYRVSTDRGDRAVKWYHPNMATRDQRDIIETLVGRRLNDSRFLWPQALVTDTTGPSGSFGYLMAVRPKEFHDLPALFRREVKGITSRKLTIVALHTAEAFLALHAQGRAYRDINYGNLFFNPANGDILICDNDNAVEENKDTGIWGTSEFMAPELMRQDTGARPSQQTDLHALAVLLFMLLMNHHPLLGKAEFDIRCFDDKAMKKLYGTAPVFLFDPGNASNRPVPGEQDTVIANWRVCPPVLRKLFTQAFTVGLIRPDQRVRETVWRDTFSQVYDSIVECGHCGRSNYVDPGANPPPVSCWKCDRTVALPPRLEVVRDEQSRRISRSIRLSQDAKIFPHHLQRTVSRHDYSQPVGEVEAHPSEPGKFGLRNSTGKSWRVHNEATRSLQDVPPGKRANLRPGLLIEFGDGVEALFREE